MVPVDLSLIVQEVQDVVIKEPSNLTYHKL